SSRFGPSDGDCAVPWRVGVRGDPRSAVVAVLRVLQELAHPVVPFSAAVGGAFSAVRIGLLWYASIQMRTSASRRSALASCYRLVASQGPSASQLPPTGESATRRRFSPRIDARPPTRLPMGQAGHPRLLCAFFPSRSMARATATAVGTGVGLRRRCGGRGAVDNAADLARGKSLRRQLPVSDG